MLYLSHVHAVPGDATLRALQPAFLLMHVSKGNASKVQYYM